MSLSSGYLVDSLGYKLGYKRGPGSGYLRRPGGLTGYLYLPDTLTINGIGPVTPQLLYAGHEAADSWPGHGGYSPTLTLAGSGSSPGYGVSHPWGPLTSYIQQKYHEDNPAASGDPGTNDFVFEMIGEVAACAGLNPVYACKMVGTTAPGWTLMRIPTDYFYFQIRDAAANQAYIWSDTPLSYAVHHFMIFGDRSEATAAYSGVLYVNGVRQTGRAINAVGSISSTDPFELGGVVSGRALCDVDVGWFGMWMYFGWFAGGATNITHWDQIAAERYAILTG
jgi:hypothetical protein